jgi:hypothetical protein
MPRKRRKQLRRFGQRNMDIGFGAWNVRTLYKAGSLLHHIQQYQLKVTAIQEIRWFGKGIFDTRSHTVL